jgi:uncharacterized protein YutE (UPF0331/DUF86 family)
MGVDIEYLKSRIKEVQESINEARRIVFKQYIELNVDEKYSLRYQLIVLVEALGSICLHIAIEDLGKEPESYSECFKLLENRSIFIRAEEIIKLVRLRNLLVHRYWDIDDAKIYNSIKGNFKAIEQLIERIRERYGLQA